MKKHVLIISSSLHTNSNSEALADEFLRGVIDAGHIAEKITLKDKTIHFCQGCMACLNLQRCAIEDDSNLISDKMRNADCIVFATPIYYYSISGQLKTLLDRANPLFSSDYKFKDIYLLASAAENEPSTFEGAQKAIQGWVDCFERAVLKNTVYAGGVNSGGEIQHHPALTKAYECGINI